MSERINRVGENEGRSANRLTAEVKEHEFKEGIVHVYEEGPEGGNVPFVQHGNFTGGDGVRLPEAWNNTSSLIKLDTESGNSYAFGQGVVLNAKTGSVHDISEGARFPESIEIGKNLVYFDSEGNKVTTSPVRKVITESRDMARPVHADDLEESPLEPVWTAVNIARDEFGKNL